MTENPQQSRQPRTRVQALVYHEGKILLVKETRPYAFWCRGAADCGVRSGSNGAVNI